MASPELSQFRRIVVKVGSALLVDSDAGEVRASWLAALAADLAKLHREGCDVLIPPNQGCCGALSVHAARVGGACRAERDPGAGRPSRPIALALPAGVARVAVAEARGV